MPLNQDQDLLADFSIAICSSFIKTESVIGCYGDDDDDDEGDGNNHDGDVGINCVT